jgi:hypothetical protein
MENNMLWNNDVGRDGEREKEEAPSLQFGKMRR